MAAENPLLAARAEKRILLVLITADKGLAGAFNTNLIKGAQRFVEEHPDAAVKLELIGRKGRDFFRKRGAAITGEHIGTCRQAAYADAAAIARKVMELYRARGNRRGLSALQRIQERDGAEAHRDAGAAGGTARQAAEPVGLHFRAAAGRNAGRAAAALRGNGSSSARCWNPSPPSTPRA